jgi:5-methyltetrahydropteroyltriglutamate--homocysteine methyltransferase
MKRSEDRILTSHAGALHRPTDVQQLLLLQSQGRPYDQHALEERLRETVTDIVHEQAHLGVDVVNDGEFTKTTWMGYVTERISGLETISDGAGFTYSSGSRRNSKDYHDFTQFYAEAGHQMVYMEPGPETESRAWHSTRTTMCTGPLEYVGYAELQRDIDNLHGALERVNVEEAFLTVVAPGSVQPWIRNEHYPDDESLFAALAAVLKEEYRTIIDAGLICQIDDAFLAEEWDRRLMELGWDLAAYRRWAEMSIDALNAAIEGLPEDRIRYHVCWGSANRPHTTDLPLGEFVDIMLRVNAQTYLIEAANARHEWEYRVWDDVQLPDGKILMPGVIEHATHVVEHPETVADRIMRFATRVGRENVIAGTDCGFRGRSHPQVAWAKLRALSDGARLASERLWR